MDEILIKQSIDDIFFNNREFPTILVAKTDGSYLAYGEPVEFDKGRIARLCAQMSKLAMEVEDELKQEKNACFDTALGTGYVGSHKAGFYRYGANWFRKIP